MSPSLSTGRVEAAIAVSDLPRARAFYEDQLGLVNAQPEPGGVRYECGEGTGVFVYESRDNAGKSPATVAGFFVADLDQTMADLRARGVEFERYDQPGLVTDDDGVFVGPDFRAGWVRDPDGNTLALTENAAEQPLAPDAQSAPVVHFEILGADPGALRSFYADLFGWEFEIGTPVAGEVSDDGLYATVPRSTLPDGTGIPGGVGGGPGRDGRTLFYVGVPEVERALASAESLGGGRVMGPSRAPGRPLTVGWFTDPEGHLVGVAGPA